MSWPTEIESDLWIHCNRTDIGWWHRLTLDPESGAPRLSSRRLLALLDSLPDESAYKTSAERGGRLTPALEIAAKSLNEQYRMRASFHAAHSTPDNDARFDPAPFFYLDPVDRAAVAERDAEEARAVEQFNAEMGYC